MTSLWNSTSPSDWRAALDSYPHVVQRQGVTRLAELDTWYREDLPGLVSARTPAHVLLEELVRLTEWKMARGEWRAFERGAELAWDRGRRQVQVDQRQLRPSVRR